MGCNCRHDAECTCPLADDAEERAAAILGRVALDTTNNIAEILERGPAGRRIVQDEHGMREETDEELRTRMTLTVEEREAARETRILEQARTLQHPDAVSLVSRETRVLVRALILAHGELAARRAGEYAIRTDFVRASGDVNCTKCGLPYRDHYEHPAEPWLHVLCDGRKVKL